MWEQPRLGLWFYFRTMNFPFLVKDTTLTRNVEVKKYNLLLSYPYLLTELP